MTGQATGPAECAAGRLIYLHGFRSSSQSFKARWLQQQAQARGRAACFVAPDLPMSPAAAARALTALAPVPGDTLVGSSLGGCYANWGAVRFGCRAVLLNPAVQPSRDLARHVGIQTGWHDGEPFTFHAAYVEELAVLEAVGPAPGARCLLVAAQGDEVLDWREMVAFHAGARQIVLPGSDHGLSDFDQVGQSVLAFVWPDLPAGQVAGLAA